MVNTHGVHAPPMKASQVPLTSRRPRRAAQLTAAGAAKVRDPATTPMSSARKYAVTPHPVHETRGPSFADAPTIIFLESGEERNGYNVVTCERRRGSGVVSAAS